MFFTQSMLKFIQQCSVCHRGTSLQIHSPTYTTPRPARVLVRLGCSLFVARLLSVQSRPATGWQWHEMFGPMESASCPVCDHLYGWGFQRGSKAWCGDWDKEPPLKRLGLLLTDCSATNHQKTALKAKIPSLTDIIPSASPVCPVPTIILFTKSRPGHPKHCQFSTFPTDGGWVIVTSICTHNCSLLFPSI